MSNLHKEHIERTFGATGAVDSASIPYDASDSVKDKLDSIDTGITGKEDSFAKNTAFNKNFGTSAGEVAEGDHDHVGVYQPLGAPLDALEVTSSVSTVDLGWVSPTAKEILIVADNIELSADALILGKASLDEGATYKAGASDYEYSYTTDGANGSATADTSIRLTRLTVDTITTNVTASFRITIVNPKNVTKMAKVISTIHSPNSTGLSKEQTCSASYQGTAGAEVDGFQFSLDTGTFEKGDFKVYEVSR